MWFIYLKFKDMYIQTKLIGFFIDKYIFIDDKLIYCSFKCI
ncbi:protein of unknown function [Bartonella clarridgeiae 73]|uniref:Uncharacterized protein n=1 Tax=Bartonella clarridgeiae (strain CCUG 45776 / CIP 104772 / 73) TaxID=696125 RepID=E6YHZ6_BARC7|nr:protein of unknown function [Bartonella clarridgeiae 73]